MKTVTLLPAPTLIHPAADDPNQYRTIQEYYTVAGPDYRYWSRNFNMHFGYCKSFADIFSLEKMLVNMNEKVLKHLHIDKKKEVHIADLGCGMGTVARHTAKKYPKAKITGITIVDEQVKKGNSLIKKEGTEARAEIIKDNFEALAAGDETFTHAYAMESACHASGDDKAFFIAEMARTLQQGGRFCITDGFLKKRNKRPALFNYFYKKMIRYWALPGFADIHEFCACLKRHGLKNIHAEEISYRIAPSVAYVPWTCIKFFIAELWKNKMLCLEKERWHNVFAPVLGMIIGLFRRHFGYYIISGEKG